MPNTILTHDGDFHADDVFGVAVLSELFPDATVVRTRNRDLLATALADPHTVLLDVGGVFDPGKGAFDHHQPSFDQRRDDGTGYATLGLVWRVYGEAYLQHLNVSDAHLTAVMRDVDAGFIRGIDATDNGEVHWFRVRIP